MSNNPDPDATFCPKCGRNTEEDIVYEYSPGIYSMKCGHRVNGDNFMSRWQAGWTFHEEP